MTKRKGPSADQRGEIEMPPLDYQMPSQLGGSPVTQAPELVSEPVVNNQQVYEEYAQEEPAEEVEQVDHTRMDEVLEEVEEPIQLEPVRSKPEAYQQENFRKVKEARERAERERDALMSQMLEMQAKLQIQQQQQQAKPVIEEEKDWFDGLDPESLVEGKQLKNIAQDLRSMKKQLREQQVQSQEIAMQAKIKSQYPDFDEVFNASTINSLNEQYPDVANALRVMPDDYNKATAAYTMIKNLGIYKNVGQEMKKPAYESDVLRAKVNAAKPRPLTSVNPQQGDSPLSKANAFANGLTPALKEQLRNEMNAARKGH